MGGETVIFIPGVGRFSGFISLPGLLPGPLGIAAPVESTMTSVSPDSGNGSGANRS